MKNVKIISCVFFILLFVSFSVLSVSASGEVKDVNSMWSLSVNPSAARIYNSSNDSAILFNYSGYVKRDSFAIDGENTIHPAYEQLSYTYSSVLGNNVNVNNFAFDTVRFRYDLEQGRGLPVEGGNRFFFRFWSRITDSNNALVDYMNLYGVRVGLEVEYLAISNNPQNPSQWITYTKTEVLAMDTYNYQGSAVGLPGFHYFSITECLKDLPYFEVTTPSGTVLNTTYKIKSVIFDYFGSGVYTGGTDTVLAHQFVWSFPYTNPVYPNGYKNPTLKYFRFAVGESDIKFSESMLAYQRIGNDFMTFDSSILLAGSVSDFGEIIQNADVSSFFSRYDISAPFRAAVDIFTSFSREQHISALLGFIISVVALVALIKVVK